LTVKAQGISEDLAQKRMKNQGVDFLEKISSNQFVAMKKEAPEEVMVKFALERNLLKEYAQYILKSTNVNDLLENWAKGRLYVNAIRRSISTKTYPIKDAQDLLAKFNRSAFKANECQDLVVFANSLIDKKARVFTFGMDQASLEFLLLSSEYSNSIVYYNKLTNSAKQKFSKALIETFYVMGIKYIPVVITDGYRTFEEQAQRVYGRGCSYYMNHLEDKTGDSYFYLEILKYIYEDKQELETVFDNAPSLIKQDAKDIIRKYQGDLLTTLKALIPEYFNPSKHTIGQSLDIRIRNGHYETAEIIKGILRKGYSSNDHIHLNLD
ncbi:MAG: hypothetical protein ACRCV0_01885, partial [Brevinema sp.]